MYKKQKIQKTSINRNVSTIGETIEQKVNRIVNNKEAIQEGTPIIYTERVKGVEPQYDIRTDRFEIAVEKMDAGAKSHIAKREERIGEQAKKGMEKENGGPESTAGNSDMSK